MVVLRRDRLDAAEADFYEALYTQSQAQFDSYVDSGTLVNNYSHIFSLLVRLRQAVGHPYLVAHSATAATDLGAGAGALAAAAVVDEATHAPGEEQLRAGVCGLCHDPLEVRFFLFLERNAWLACPFACRIGQENVALTEGQRCRAGARQTPGAFESVTSFSPRRGAPTAGPRDGTVRTCILPDLRGRVLHRRRQR